jgi:predicted dehydrogenase/threonine dehydrogenase-like Zn-dependent dehydrogenase
MKQIVRRIIDSKGKVKIEEIPTPLVGDNQVLISNLYSLISSGTELGTINKDPIEMVKLTLQDPWMRNEVKNLIFGGSINETVDIMKNELYLMRMFGYSGAGIVIDKGKNIHDIHVGDKVAYAAQGHAEQVSAFANHVVKVPDSVDLRHAAFVTVGGIALQGLRRADVKIGEWIVIYGLGLVGQITVQLLLAAGAKVIGVDISEEKIALSDRVGLKYMINPKNENVIDAVMKITNGKGADSTIICAVSQDPVITNNAMKITRKQGKVVFVGIVKMELERKPFFERELDLLFSRAYGPGSYDDLYEKGRVDYPYPYVRWTEKRNLEEIIRLIEDKRINFELLIDSEYTINEAQVAFDRIRRHELKSVAILLSYPQETEIKKTITKSKNKKVLAKDIINVGVIGAGNFTRNYHIPNLNRIKGFHIRGIATATGINAASSAKLYPVDYITTDYNELLNDKEIDLVIVATRHDTHAKIAAESAKAGKHIFVEKPIVMNIEEMESLKSAILENNVHFMAGYNRRYSPISISASKFITQLPVMIRYTVNIQHLPDTHWTLDDVEGGGRLIGESGHFFDLMNFFIKSKPVEVQAISLPVKEDIKTGLFNFAVQVKYENNSIGQLLYTSMGGPKLERENVEIFCGNKHVEIKDFKKMYVNQKKKFGSGGMGHLEELQFLLNKIKSDPAACFEEVEKTLYADWICIKAQEFIK